MTTDLGRPPAGWYPHPSMAGTQRYWDGAKWTDHMAPIAVPVRVRVPVNNDVLKVIGWLSVLVFPLVGFVIGFVIGARNEQNHGLAMVLASVIASGLWYAVSVGYI